MSKDSYWYGLKNIWFIYHGEWSDPEISNGEYICNINDVEDDLLEIYRDEHPDDKNDEGFDAWMEKQDPDYVSELIEEYGLPLDDDDKARCYWQMKDNPNVPRLFGEDDE